MQNKCLQLSHKNRKVKGTVHLTGSKSECNRALIIQALSKGLVHIENVSNAADTVTLMNALEAAGHAGDKRVTIDIGPAGTAMRFLTSYLNLVPGSFLLTGTQRMQERPIGLLTDALRKLGAQISFSKKHGFPPLEIEGKMTQVTNEIQINGNISSQYISSLLLVAPILPKGLILKIKGELASKPYVSMTLDMMKRAGIHYEWEGSTIRIDPQEYQKTALKIEPDWSAASYWYSIVALSESGEIFLKGLQKNSIQGDSEIADIMAHFGVKSTFQSDGVLLQKTDESSGKTHFDFKKCPDLAQTIVVLATALKRDLSFSGLETLKIKETDRVAALQNEIGKYGAQLIEEGETYYLKTENVLFRKELRFSTYEDHRMAMAFAPLALMGVLIQIEEPDVVEKSYPDFWKDLVSTGFRVNNC